MNPTLRRQLSPALLCSLALCALGSLAASPAAQAGRIVQTTINPNSGLKTKTVTVYQRDGDIRKVKEVTKPVKEPRKQQGSGKSGKGVVGDDGAYGANRSLP